MIVEQAPEQHRLRFGTLAAAGTVGALLIIAWLALAESPRPGSALAADCSIAWNGRGATDSWHDPTNWDTTPPRAPSGGDHVCVPADAPGATVSYSASDTTIASLRSDKPLALSGGTLTVREAASLAALTLTGGAAYFDAATTIAVVDQSAGTIAGKGVVTVTVRYTWSGGMQGADGGAGETAVASGAQLRMSGSATSPLTVLGRTVSIRTADAVWTTTGELKLAGTSPRFVNEGVLSISMPAAGRITGGELGKVVNRGTIDVSSFASHSLFVGAPFDGSAGSKVNLSGVGSLTLEGGGTYGGTFSLGSAPLRLENGAFEFTGDSSIAGAELVAATGAPTAIILGVFDVRTTTIDAGDVWFGKEGVTSAAPTIRTLKLNGGRAVFEDDAEITDVEHVAGDLGGPGTVTVTNRYLWIGGSQSGVSRTQPDGTVALLGQTSIPPGALLTLSGLGDQAARVLRARRLVNHGAAQWLTLGLKLADRATLQTDGSFLVSGSAQPAKSLTVEGSGGTLLVSGGAFRVVDNILAVDASVQTRNGSVLRAENGSGTSTLVLRGGSDQHGTLEVSPGSVVNFSGGKAHALDSDSRLSADAGTVIVRDGGRLTVRGAYRAGRTEVWGDAVAFERSDGVSGPGIGEFVVHGGEATFNAVTALGALQQSGGELAGTALVSVSGAFTWTGGSQTGTGATSVRGDGVGIELSGDGTRTLSTRSVTTSSGGLWKGAGTLELRDGAMFALAGGEFLVTESSYATGKRPIFGGTGGGTVAIGEAATMVLDAPFAIASTLSNGGLVRWQKAVMLALEGGGSHTGAFALPTEAASPAGWLWLGGPARHEFLGDASVAGSRGFVSVRAEVKVAGSWDIALVDVAVGGESTFALGSGPRIAKLEISGGTATFASKPTLGEVSLHDGLVSLAAGAVIDKVMNEGGELKVGNGKLDMGAGGFVQTAGTTTLAEPESIVRIPDGRLDLQGGVLSGVGTVDASLTNAGEVHPGNGVGTLTVIGNYEQKASGVLRVEVRKGGASFDKLAAGGSVSLAGALQLDVSGQVKPPPEGLRVLAAALRTGEFTDFMGAPCHGVKYEPSAVLLIPIPCHKVLSGQDIAAIPQLAVSGNDVVAVWAGRSVGEGHHIWFRRGIHGTNFAPAQRLSDVHGGYRPKIAADGQTVCIAWEASTGRTFQQTDVFLAMSRDGGKSFSVGNASRREPEGPSSFDAEAAASRSYCYMAWTELLESKVSVKLAREIDGVRQSEHLGRGASPAIAASGGRVHIAWNNELGELVVRSVKDGKGLGPAKQISAKGGSVQLAADGEDVYAVWEKCASPLCDPSELVVAASVDAGESFGEPILLGRSPVKDYPVIAANAGAAYVAWTSPWGRCLYEGELRPCGGEDAWHADNGLWFVKVEGGAIIRRDRLHSRSQYHPGDGKAQIAALGDDVAVAASVEQSEGAFNEGDLFVYRSTQGGAFRTEELSANPGWSGTYGGAIDAMHDIGFGPSGLFVVWQDGERTTKLSKEKQNPPRWDVYFAARPSGPPDVRVVEFEPVQAVFDPDALVAGKDTMLKVVVADSLRDAYTPATLEVSYDEVVLDADRVPVTKRATKQVQVLLGAGENVFYLPGDSHGTSFHPGGPTFAAEVKVVVPAGVADVNSRNNTMRATAPVKETRRFDVLFVPVLVRGQDGTVGNAPTCAQVRTIASGSRAYLHATFPVAAAKAKIAGDCASPLVVGPGPLTRTAVDGVFRALEARTLGTQYVKVVGVVRKGFFESMTLDYRGAVALAPHRHDLDAVIAEYQLTGGWGVAHELSHQMGWIGKGHKMSDHSRGQTYPGAEVHASDVPAPGYWVARRKPVTDRIDFMHPSITGADPADATARWVSNTTYEYLFTTLKADPADPPVLALAGYVGKDGHLKAEPWYELDSFYDAELGDAGDYGVRFLDGAGNVLGETAFDVSFLRASLGEEHGAIEVDESAFSIRVPQVAGTRKVAITRGDEVLYERTRSASVPVVTVTSPNGGEQLRTGTATELTWSGSDADGDALTYLVSLSLDGGQTWTPLATDLADERLTIDLRRDHLTEAGLIRVVATDGWNTAEDRSDTTFSVIPFVAEPVEKIAFASGRDGNAEIYVMNADGGDQVRLTDHPREDYGPVFSPDGSRIAFVSERADHPDNPFVGMRNIWVMNADGTDPTRLTSSTEPDEKPVWSPDGSRIAFIRARHNEFGEFISYDLHVINADGTGEQRLSVNGAGGIGKPAWSPDGARIAFSRLGYYEGAYHVLYGQLFVVNADGTGEHRLTFAKLDYGGGDGGPVWSPDGARIAFSRTDYFGSARWHAQIFVVNADGTGARRLTFENATNDQPKWSPDGGHIAFVRDYGAFTYKWNSDIWVMRADGSNQRLLADSTPCGSSGCYDDDPQWSPDGTRIAFRYHLNAIGLVNLDGSGIEVLTGTQGGNSHHTWGLVTPSPPPDDEEPPPPPPPPPGGKAEPGGPYAAREGEIVTLDASRSSRAEGSVPLYEWDLDGDGAYDDAVGIRHDAVFDQNGTFTIGLRVTEQSGALATATTTVTVANVAPTVDAGPDHHGSHVVSLPPATFVDAGGLDEHTATVDWGDGTSSEGNVAEFGRSGTVTASHRYRSSGTYTMKVTVCDDDGGCGDDTLVAEVTLDESPPVTTAARAPEPTAHGWANAPVTVTLTASDGDAGSGVKSIEYAVTGVQEGRAVVPGDTASVTVDEEGVTTVAYFARDRAGNVEATRTTTVRVDRTPPATVVDQPPLVVISLLGGALTGTATDTVSGIEHTKIRLVSTVTGAVLERQAICTADCDGPDTQTWRVPTAGILPGPYTATAWSADLAGNTGPATAPVEVVIV